MIKSITLRFGRAPDIPAMPISTAPVTVFVGPNNSGKSKVLQELTHHCTSGQNNPNNLILDRIDFEPAAPETIQEKIQHILLKPNASELLHPHHVIVGKNGSRQQVHQQHLANALLAPNTNLPMFCRWYLAYNTLMLDGQSRIHLVGNQQAGDLQQPPQLSFQVLFRDDKKRAEVRRIIKEAFGDYLTIYPTQLGHFRLRLSTFPPSSDLEERGIHEEAVKFHGNAKSMDFLSDGVKSFYRDDNSDYRRKPKDFAY